MKIEIELSEWEVKVLNKHYPKKHVEMYLNGLKRRYGEKIFNEICDLDQRLKRINEIEEKNNDIKKMLLVLSALTEEGTEGFEQLQEWYKKYDPRRST